MFVNKINFAVTFTDADVKTSVFKFTRKKMTFKHLDDVLFVMFWPEIKKTIFFFTFFLIRYFFFCFITIYFYPKYLYFVFAVNIPNVSFILFCIFNDILK